MSHITTILLTHSLSEDFYELEGDSGDVYPIHEKLNAFFTHCTGFCEIDGGLFGGSKYPHCILLAGAFNYLDMQAFCTHMRGLKWEVPESVQLIVKFDEGERFQFVDWRKQA